MKKIGRGTSYRTALLNNLRKSLLTHKKIQTTRSRGKQLVKDVSQGENVHLSMTNAPRRRGDNAPQVIVEIIENTKKQHDTPNKTKTD